MTSAAISLVEEEALLHLDRLAAQESTAPEHSYLDLNAIHGEFEKMEAYREWKEQQALPQPSSKQDTPPQVSHTDGDK